MKIFVTGGYGFIGKHLIRRLLRETAATSIVSIGRSRELPDDLNIIRYPSQFSLNEIQGDLENEDRVAKILQAYRPDVIFHLAGKSTVKADSENPCDIGRSNIMATHHLLAHCPEGCRFVFASSATVYGDICQQINHPAYETTSRHPTSVYGACKQASEDLVNTYSNGLRKVSGLNLRLVANVGQGATHGVVPDLIKKLKSSSSTLDLLGDSPGSLKHYTHVTDTVEAFIKLGFNPAIRGSRNIASSDQLTIGHLAAIVMDASGIVKPIKWLGNDANWKGDNAVVKVDSGAARAMGWKPFFDKSADAVRQAVKEMML